jgi:hypothetical protein
MKSTAFVISFAMAVTVSIVLAVDVAVDAARLESRDDVEARQNGEGSQCQSNLHSTSSYVGVYSRLIRANPVLPLSPP